MSNQDNKFVEVSLPGEWALKKVLGPVLGELGEDMKKLYATGRDNILIASYKKVLTKDDKKQANLRVARDVFWNGSFTDESICAEYFGGILASSRSDNGSDDTGVYYVDLIKSLSSYQLKLHYLIYSSVNRMLLSDNSKKELNPGQESELRSAKIFLSVVELNSSINVDDYGRDLHAIHTKGLIGDFRTNEYKLSNGEKIPYIEVTPTPLGIQLYTVAFNKLTNWRLFSTTDFGKLNDIDQLKFYGKDVDTLLISAGINDKEQPVKL